VAVKEVKVHVVKGLRDRMYRMCEARATNIFQVKCPAALSRLPTAVVLNDYHLLLGCDVILRYFYIGFSFFDFNCSENGFSI